MNSDRGLYAILTAADVGDAQMSALAEAALRGGAVMLQYRDKRADASRREAGARAVAQTMRGTGVPLIVNDDIALAARIGADGVHLGRGDAAIVDARRTLGNHALIGASCHASIEYAHEALAAGADHVSFGRFFPSLTKPGAPPAPVSLLSDARRELKCPVVAIGGINADNGARLLAQGANYLAVSAAIFDQRDPTAAARRISDLFS